MLDPPRVNKVIFGWKRRYVLLAAELEWDRHRFGILGRPSACGGIDRQSECSRYGV
jgi:hypothetical protein